MRHSNQLALTAPWIGHEHATELAVISDVLAAQPRLAALIQQDLLAACPHNPRTGRAGLTGDQVLRMLVARQLNGWTYAELAFHLADSVSYRTGTRLGMAMMTISDYLKVMKSGAGRQVRVAELKAKLSAYLRAVRRGQSLVVLDRDTPVARVVPYDRAEPLRVGRPLGRRRLQDVPLPPPLAHDVDIVALLMEERQGEP